MSYATLKIPTTPKTPLPSKAAGQNWKTLRVRKKLWECLIMIQAAKVLRGEARPSMTDLITEMTSIAAPAMMHPEALAEPKVEPND